MITAQKQNKFTKIELIREKREDNRLDIGVIPRPVLSCGIPLQKPAKDYLVHKARNGNCEFVLLADGRYGMPFGRDIITPLWLFSEVFEQKSRTIRFKSGRAMLQSMGLHEDGHSFQWVTGSIMRCFGARWNYTIEREVMNKMRREDYWFSLIDDSLLWFNKDTQQLAFEADGYENHITVTEKAYELAMHRGYQSRVELEVVAALSTSPGALTLYMMLRDRAAQVPEHKLYGWVPLTGPQGLDLQMGVKPYDRQRDWRRKVSKWLDEISLYWPECCPEIHEGSDGFYRLMVPRLPPAGTTSPRLA